MTDRDAPTQDAPAQMPTETKRDEMPHWMKVTGWYGVLAILGAYALISFGQLNHASVTYQILNLTGALAVGLICVRKRAWQPLALNVVWAVIAATALWRAVP
jgi:hypothetical protein